MEPICLDRSFRYPPPSPRHHITEQDQRPACRFQQETVGEADGPVTQVEDDDRSHCPSQKSSPVRLTRVYVAASGRNEKRCRTDQEIYGKAFGECLRDSGDRHP